jgi:ABC-type iron transport system FetAB permease component
VGGALRFVTHFPSYVQQWTVALTILLFSAIVAAHMVEHRRVSVRDLPLDSLLLRVFAGSSIPTGVLLLICAFDNRVLVRANEIGVYIATAGLTLIYLSVRELFDRPPALSAPAAHERHPAVAMMERGR